jgi:hypothetical protein
VTVHVEHGATFPVQRNSGFEFITATANSPGYWADLLRVGDGRFAAVGDRQTVTMRLLRREVELQMQVRRFEPPAYVEYVTSQRGLPDALHQRFFDEEPEGFAYRAVVQYEPRGGFRSLFDRTLLRAAVRRALRQTIRNLRRELG